jgi:hypothetical protein
MVIYSKIGGLLLERAFEGLEYRFHSLEWIQGILLLEKIQRINRTLT